MNYENDIKRMQIEHDLEAARTAGNLLGIAAITAHRWLWLLEKDGFLETVQKGRRNYATRFRFIGGQNAIN